MVVNDVGVAGIGFDAADNEVTVLTPGGETSVPRAGKEEVASAILDVVLSLRSETAPRVGV